MTAPTLEKPPPPPAAPEVRIDEPRRSIKDALFKAAMVFSLSVGMVTLVILLVDVVTSGWPRLNWALITNFPSINPAKAGIESALWGTIWVIGFTALFTIPVGVAAAVYLEEFADSKRWYNRLIELNIQNLAAVPSIVYGILGLGLIVRAAGFGPTVAAGALVLTLLILPIVIIAARESLRSVPDSIRQGSLAVGATPMQTVWRQTLPSAVPGIATGVILALSRAIGEAAPLLLVSGGLVSLTYNPTGLDSRFAILPIQIYNWIGQSRDEFQDVLAPAAIVVMLVILLAMNSIAIFVRNKFQRSW